jgi:transposase InsO family protein
MDETDASHEQFAAQRRHQAQSQANTNAVLESFHASLKKDLIHRQAWPTKAEARTAVFDYIEAFVRHEALLDRAGCETPPLGCRSGPVKLRAV